MINALNENLRAGAVLAALGASAVIAVLTPPAAAAPIRAFTTRRAYKFVSAPKLHPPKLSTDAPTKTSKLAPGYFIVANFKDLGENRRMVGQSGPLMLDHQLQPVWFAPVPTNVLAGNLRVQTYNGKPALSWWQGVVDRTGVTLSGEDEVVDQHYRKVATVTGQGGWIISQHEMVISGHDAWVTAYKNVPMDLTPFHGSATGTLLDSAVQEYDLTTGNLLFTWDALQHISPSESKTTPAPGMPWDAYHINSIQLTGHETFLVSMRNTWGVYLVDRLTSNIEWTLGGKNSTFSFGKNAAFQWQHDAQLQ